VNFRKPEANVAEEPAVNPPLDASQRDEEEEYERIRARDIELRREEDNDIHKAMLASEWTRSVVAHANVAFASPAECAPQPDREYSDDTIREWIAEFPNASKYMTMDEVCRAIRWQKQLRLEARHDFVRESNIFKRRATRPMSDEVRSEMRARAMDQCWMVTS
jgi:hypothetical protein